MSGELSSQKILQNNDGTYANSPSIQLGDIYIWGSKELSSQKSLQSNDGTYANSPSIQYSLLEEGIICI
jgi:hypothetical protein